MKQYLTIFLLTAALLTGGAFLYKSQSEKWANWEKYHAETINNRSFYKTYKYSDYYHNDEKTDDDTLNNNIDPENIPKIITYGLNIFIDVDNQNRSQEIDEVNTQQKVTAQCDLQTIYDEEFNIFDIAVSYTMIDKHDILSNSQEQEQEEEQQLLSQEEEQQQEQEGEEEFYERDDMIDYEDLEIDTPQNYFYKLLVHADSGEVLSMQIEIDMEEEPILTYATQQLISDIFPELRKGTYEKGVLESDNLGTIKVEYKQSDVDEENINIFKEFDENDYVQKQASVDYKVNYGRNIILKKENGVVNEGNTDMKFSFGQPNAVNINLQQAEGEGEEDLDVEALGQITGDMKCAFWVVPASEEDDMIASEMFRYRQETEIFEDIRLSKDLKANLEYGDGEAEPFELIDIDEDHDVVTVDSDEYIKSDKATIYFEQYKQQQAQEQLKFSFFGNSDDASDNNGDELSKNPMKHKHRKRRRQAAAEEARRQEAERQRLAAEAAEQAAIQAELARQQEVIRQAEEAKRIEEEQRRAEEERARQEQLEREEQAKIARAESVLETFNQMNMDRAAIEAKAKAKVAAKVTLDTLVETKNRIRDEALLKLETVAEEFKNIGEDLKNLKDVKEHFIGAKVVIQGQISRHMYDIKENLKISGQKHLDRVNREVSRFQETLQVVEKIAGSVSLDEIKQQLVDSVKSEIGVVQEQAKTFGEQLKGTIEQEKQKLEVLINKAEEIKNMDLQTVSADVQAALSADFNSIISDIKGVIKGEQDKIDADNLNLTTVVQKLEEIQNTIEGIPEELKQEINNITSQIKPFIQERLDSVVQKNTKIMELVELGEKIKNIDLEQVANEVKMKAQEEIFNAKQEVKQTLQNEYDALVADAKAAVEEAFAAEIAMFEAEKERIAEAEKVVKEMHALAEEIVNFPAQMKEQLENIKNEATGAVKDAIEAEIDRLVNLDEARFPPPNGSNAQTFRESKTLAKVKVLGKEIGVDLVYTGYIEESRVGLKLRVGDKYVATVLQKSFNNCQTNLTQNIVTKDFTFFKAVFPVLGIITIPVTASGRVQYGYTTGVTAGPRMCSFKFEPEFKAGVYAEGAISLAGIISAGIYAQGNFLDTRLKLEAMTNHGKSSVELSGQFHAYSFEMGATYTKISCSLKNIKKDRRLLTSEDDSELNELDRVRRNLGLKRTVKKVKKTVKRVAHQVKTVGKKVVKVAQRVIDEVKKAYEIAINLHKICKKSKGTISICKYSSSPKQRTMWYKEINIGL